VNSITIRYRLCKYKFLKNIIISISFFSFLSCNVCKYVPEDKNLLKKVNIELIGPSQESNFLKEDLHNLLAQKPNRKLFSNFRFYLFLYNLSNQERIDKKVIDKQAKIDKVNENINLRNEFLLSLDSSAKLKNLKERKLVFGERLQLKGEAPVIFSPFKSVRSKDQFSKFLSNKGYFQNSILDSTFLSTKNREIELTYFIDIGKPTYLNEIKYLCKDEAIFEYLDSIKSNSLLKKGEVFDTDNLINERDRISKYLRNRGFYSFNKEFIYFDLDSNNRSKKINLNLGIQNYKKTNSGVLEELHHKKYSISKINIRIKPDLTINSNIILDSFTTPFLSIYNYQSIKFKKKIFKKSILLKKDDFYRHDYAKQTYKRLISLGLFNYVNIGFDTVGNNHLVGYIDLNPAKAQNISFSLDGTNNERLFGFQGSFDYVHNNLFHAGERLLISLKSSFEIQLLLTDAEMSDISNNINTREIGPEFHFYLPKYFLINKLGNLKNHINPLTEFTGAFNVRERPDYDRVNQEFSFGWVFHEKKNITWHINPLLLSVVDVDISSEFQEIIDDFNDSYISASFQDHVVAGGIFSFEFNNQKLNYNANAFYCKTTFESAGGALFRMHELMQKEKNILTNSYDFLGIRYAHFQKATLDIRYYQSLLKESKMVYRLFSGIGIPRNNFKEALPFEKSFFAGGSNSLRAWRARSIGPGKYFEEEGNFDKIGDIKFEGNLEYRFPISKWLEGAMFMDFGNIWLMGYDSSRQGGQFKWNSAINEIAIGGGLGLRLNFEYFILRMDFAVPLRNPYLKNDIDRWIFNEKFDKIREEFKPQLNIGIGYPF
jgi:outer membrane protein assembly factor BamA